MRKSWLLMAAIVVAAFAVITLLKQRGEESTENSERLGASEKQRIQAFWNHFNEANRKRLEGNFPGAAQTYRKALEFDPAHEESLYYLGNSLFEVGRYAEAADTYKIIIGLNPRSNRALAQLGITLSTPLPNAPINFPAARKAFERSIEINREESGPFLRLGLLNLHDGDWKRALENFEIAAGFPSPEGNFLAGYTLFLQRKPGQGQNAEAGRFFQNVLDAWETERKIAARGVLSEGDVLPSSSKPSLTPLEKAALKSALFLEWNSPGAAQKTSNPFRRRLQKAEKNRFRDAGPKVGLKPSGGRGAWADFNNDGKDDLIVVGQNIPVSLYRNRDGQLEEATRAAGLDGVRDAWDSVWADIDHDGDPDLYLLRSGFIGTGRNTLFRNNGNGTFTDVTAAMGLAGERGTSRVVFFDYDEDGRLDLLEVGSGNENNNISSVRLFRNQGTRFVERTEQAGLVSQDTAVDASVGDYNKDGKPDLFVLFRRRPATLYKNDGGKKFSDATGEADLEEVGGNSFSAVFFDYDRDGNLDLAVSRYDPFENVARCLLQDKCPSTPASLRLFRNRGSGNFQEVTTQAGLAVSAGTLQILASDLDGDGWKDLLCVNGGLGADRLEPSLILKNLQGRTFAEWAYLPGLDRPANFLGAALGDLDGDGDPDIYMGRNPRIPTEGNSSRLFFKSAARSPATPHKY